MPKPELVVYMSSIFSMSGIAKVVATATCFFLFVPVVFAGDAFDVTYRNPTGRDSIEELILDVLTALIVIVTPIIVLMIIYGGFLYVTARGNAEQIRKATATLTYAIIGGALVITAVAITTMIEASVEEFRAELPENTYDSLA